MLDNPDGNNQHPHYDRRFHPSNRRSDHSAVQKIVENTGLLAFQRLSLPIVVPLCISFGIWIVQSQTSLSYDFGLFKQSTSDSLRDISEDVSDLKSAQRRLQDAVHQLDITIQKKVDRQ